METKNTTKLTIPFEFWSGLTNDSLFFAVVDEHPQTIAVIVCCLQPAQAAYILEALPPERQLSVIRRIALMRQVESAVIRLVEVELKNQLAYNKYASIGGVDRLSEVLTDVESGTLKCILENLGQDDPELVEELKQGMSVVKTLRQREKANQILTNN